MIQHPENGTKIYFLSLRINNLQNHLLHYYSCRSLNFPLLVLVDFSRQNISRHLAVSTRSHDIHRRILVCIADVKSDLFLVHSRPPQNCPFSQVRFLDGIFKCSIGPEQIYRQFGDKWIFSAYWGMTWLYWLTLAKTYTMHQAKLIAPLSLRLWPLNSKVQLALSRLLPQVEMYLEVFFMRSYFAN